MVCCCPGKGCCKDKSDTGLAEIKRDRGCTDCLFLLLYIASWVVMIALILQAKHTGGNPYKITRGVDMTGAICGVDDVVKNQPYAAWPYPQDYRLKICVADCSYTNLLTSVNMAWRYRSIATLGAYCTPLFISNDTSIQLQVTGNLGQSFQDATSMFIRMVGDLETSSQIIAFSGLVALIVTFLFVFILRFVAGILVFVCIAMLSGGGALLGYTMLQMSKNITPDQVFASKQVLVLKWGGIIVLVGTILFLLVILALYYQIRIAVEVVKEGAEALGDMKSLIFFPVVPGLIGFAYFALWAVGMLYICSSSELISGMQTPPAALNYGVGFEQTVLNPFGDVVYGGRNNLPATFSRFQITDKYVKGAGAFHFFHLLWTIQIIVYFGHLVICGALADWYFTPRGPSGRKVRGNLGLGSNPVLSSIWRATRYHLGTVIFAGLIIAIIQFIRAVILYVENQTKSATGEPNAIQKAVFCLLQCCLKCIECCVDKINKTALVWTAVYGDGFCSSAFSAFGLIWRNLGRISALNIVSGVLMTMGKFTVALTTMGLFGFGFNTLPQLVNSVSSPILPCIFIFGLSFTVASVFLMVFESIVDTTFFCFLIDSECNKSGEMFASVALQKLVGKYSKKSEKRAALLRKRDKKQDQDESQSEKEKPNQDDDDDL